jgi:phage terminase large subunit
MSIEFTLPYNGWDPRPHQMALWQYLQNGGKRAVAVWHRRAGKDEVALHHTAVAAAKRVGNFWHCLPEYEQARRAIWTAVNPHSGIRRIDEVFPLEWRENTNDTTMFIRFKNGSTWACIGSDNFNATMGASPAGIVYSEYALSNPSAWAYHRPMLQENNGWALFITTPRGHNHAKTIYEMGCKRKDWFAQLLTARDTGALSEAELAETLAEYETLYGEAGRAAFEQEYECSFNAAILGSFYAKEMADVRKDGRILSDLQALPDRAVHRAWDLGIGDDTSIWWFQTRGAQLAILDHYAASGVGLEHFAEVIEKRGRKHGWQHGTDYVPHDAKVRELGTGRTRVETMSQLGLKPQLVPMASIDDGINAVRRTLPLCVFHPRTEQSGINALEQYRREWDDDKKAFRQAAVHDWTCHPADAFRYLALSWRPPLRVVRNVHAPRGMFIPPPSEPRAGSIQL